MDIDARVVWTCIEIELKKMMFRMKEMEKHKAKQDRINRRNAQTETENENENEDLRNKKQKMETETETQKTEMEKQKTETATATDMETETTTDMEKQKMKTEEEEEEDAIAKAPRPSFKPPRMVKYMPMYCTPNSARLFPGTFHSIPVDPCSIQLPPPEPPVARNFWGYDMVKHKAKRDRINRRNAENEDLRNEKKKMETEAETQKTATDMEKQKMKTETEMNQQEDAAIAKAPRMDKYRPMYCTPNSARLPGTFQCIPVDPCSIPWPPPEPPVQDNFWEFW